MKAYIDSVVVEGFKSYGLKRINIPIGEGFIAVVGPNGAGKSNIGDAISFCLGIATTKTLRAKNLSYLIFSKDGVKADYAYVEVHFKNYGAFPVDEENIVVSRKVSKDGRSVFKVNGTTVREKDLKDFLSKAGIYESGYNVVLQGDIIKFLKMTPLERRRVIEEVAGISEYEQKKERALKDLYEIDIKLRELELLIENIELQLKKLHEEREKLYRYRELSKSLRENKLKLLFKEINSVNKEKEALESQQRKLEAELEAIKGKIAEKGAELEALEERLKEINDRLLPYREKVGKVSSDIEHIDKRIKENEKRIEELGKEREAEIEKISYLRRDLANLTVEKEELLKGIFRAEEELEELRVEKDKIYEEFKELDKKLKVSLEEAHKTEEREKKLRSSIEEKKKRLEKITLRLHEIDIKVEKTREDVERLKSQMEEIENTSQQAQKELEKLKELKKREEKLIEEEKKKILRAEGELKNVRTKIEELLKEKAVIENKLRGAEDRSVIFEGIEGVYGSVGDLIKVQNIEYLKAIEVAGGARLRYIVVESEDVAKRCIELLKKHKLGRMSFIPLNRIRTQKLPNFPRRKGAVDFVVNLLEYEERFEKAILFAFGDTLLVEDFESAKAIGIGNYRMVTLEGELFEKTGVISGGDVKGGELGRKFYEEELKLLNAEENRLRGDEAKSLENLRKLRGELAEREGLLKVIESKIKELEISPESGAKVLEEYKDKIKKAEDYIHILLDEKENLREEAKQLRESVDYEEEKLKNLSIKRQDIMRYYRESGIEERRKEYERKLKLFEEKKEELSGLRIELEKLEADIEALRREVHRREELADRLEQDRIELGKEIERLSLEKLEKQDSVREIEAEVYRLYKEKDELEEAIKDLQSEMGSLRIKEEDAASSLSKLEMNAVRLGQKLTDLMERLSELGYEGEEIPEVTESATKLKDTVNRLEKELELLGGVNMNADEDYKELEDKFRDYKDRDKRLREERKAVKQMIEEIDAKKLHAFTITFKEINKNLKRTFRFLSPGGKAEMLLEDEVDPFRGGVHLIVKPRGKDVQYLEAMSGGEKTLAALSLIFAIQDYKPSPFYYFDEVDAHLDEANARKVGELIKEKSKNAQFIVVTLREVLATFSDKLIGVSSRGGISRVFPVVNSSEILQEIAS